MRIRFIDHQKIYIKLGTRSKNFTSIYHSKALTKYVKKYNYKTKIWFL